MKPGPLRLFSATGVELEYMIVDAGTLDVRPVSDELIRRATGDYQSDVPRGRFCWSNELVLHVVELKTDAPEPSLEGLAAGFQAEVAGVNGMLEELGARLLPTAMHPWMDPARETRLWPHEYSAVYEAYDRIFGCRGHGWSNLQSQHLNLPFADDLEFGRLHAAIRALLPLLPGLAASSPVMDGQVTGRLDTRLGVYRGNSVRIPRVTGDVVPEPVFTREEYEREIFEPLYRDIAPHDPEGVLQDEFLNARGAIARFGRGSIEIRVLDVQECPAADLAIARLVDATLRAMDAGRWEDPSGLRRLETLPLARLMETVEVQGERARVEEGRLLAHLGWRGRDNPEVGELWAHLADSLGVEAGMSAVERRALGTILDRGPLARRILAALGPAPTRPDLRRVYGQLADQLEAGEPLAG